FTYDAAGKLVKWEGYDNYYTYAYNGDKIIARHYYDKTTNELLYVDSIWYNTDNTIREMRFHEYDPVFMEEYFYKLHFEYQAGRLSRTVAVEYYDFGGGLMTDTFPTSVHWNAAGNIEKLRYLDQAGVAYDSISYQYDANPNYFKVVHPHFFLLDPEFYLHVGLEANLPYFYSRNNVVDTNIYGTFDNPISYGRDSLNQVTSVDMGGFEYFKYRYRCE
ncbi:MAG TPA: hypothetical protein VD996_15675, partial [Chitinophagaceae bacterium]|nr:hypothetical protein [Chitinophagaceae bacterium]